MIAGHEKVIESLKNLADNRTLGHAYLFYGPDQVGKKYIAKSLALYFEKGSFESLGTPLNDLKVIEYESANIGIDEIRHARPFLWQSPITSSRKTLIIDNAQLLTEEAQNALLKATEEPSPSGLIILVLPDPEVLRPTLRSRFQEIYFSTVSNEKIIKLLANKNATKKAAQEIAKSSFGKPGLATAIYENEEFQTKSEQARKFLGASDATRKDLVKKILEDEEFKLGPFLDLLILAVAQDGRQKREPAFWHRLLEVRQNAVYFNLNPRLQLEYLMHYE